MPIRVLLSDDEALARERLRRLLDDEADLEIVAECGDGKSAIAMIKREKPDLVFLDIQMPEIDGFGVVSALKEQMPLTIFVTAYDRYAMKAFEVHALDYLLKPVGKERLAEALGHARKQLQHPSEAMFQRRVLDMLDDLDWTISTRASTRRGVSSSRPTAKLSASSRWRSTGPSRRATTSACTSEAAPIFCARPSPRWNHGWGRASFCGCTAPRW